MSDKWQARQKARDNGKYSEMNKCELCGKPLGDYGYCSDERVDTKFSGLGLILCEKHGELLADASDDTALYMLQSAEKYRKEGKYLLPQPGKNRRIKVKNHANPA